MTLDGMRGAAALLVLMHHAVFIAVDAELVPRGYLAVDFFFMLSGFVMAYSYEPRFAGGLSATSFMVARLRRLYPTIAIGVILGGVSLLAAGSSIGHVGRSAVIELLFIPRLQGGDAGVFELDGVQWSLFFELIANALHVLVFRRLSRSSMAVVAGIALGVVGYFACMWGDLAIGDRSSNFAGGVPRVLFPYVLGILIARLPPRFLPRAYPAGIPVLALVITILSAGLLPQGRLAWLADIAIVATVFPALILLAAAPRPVGDGSRLASLGGDMSFPLYAVHLPVINFAVLLGVARYGRSLPLLALALAAVATTTVLWRVTTKTFHGRRRQFRLVPAVAS